MKMNCQSKKKLQLLKRKQENVKTNLLNNEHAEEINDYLSLPNFINPNNRLDYEKYQRNKENAEASKDR